MKQNAHNAPEAQNRKLTVSYDGTGYSGWQIQPEKITVQGELQAALGRITGETPLPQGSGRTDAGVHALGQVASFLLHVPIPDGNLLMALNRTLPASIRVLEVRAVKSTFHARHSALAKTYEYRVFPEKSWPWMDKRSPSRICPPFLAPYLSVYPWPLELTRMQEAAKHFVGEHDFLSFAATDPDLLTRNAEAEARPLPRNGFTVEPPAATVRTIHSSEWLERETDAGPILVYRVRGSGFLHHMVRNLVGTMLDVGRGQIAVEAIPQIIAARRRSAAGPTAPPTGLFLHSVEYDEADMRLEEETGLPTLRCE